MFELIYFLIFVSQMLAFIWAAKKMDGDDIEVVCQHPTLGALSAFAMCALWPLTLLCTIIIILKERAEK